MSDTVESYLDKRAVLWFPDPAKYVKEDYDTNANRKADKWLSEGEVKVYDRHPPLFRLSRENTRMVCVRVDGSEVDLLCILIAYGKNSNKDEDQFIEDLEDHRERGGKFRKRAREAGVENYLREYEKDTKFLVEKNF